MDLVSWAEKESRRRPEPLGRRWEHDEAAVVSDALTYCDLTTGPRGQRITATERIRDMQERYGAESLVSRAVRAASADLLAMVERTERRLEGA
jgi:hypothetical protein